jgi:GT2 family glycosyltransferase
MIKENEVTIIIPHLGSSPESEYAFDQCLLSLSDFSGRVIGVHNGLNECKHKGLCSMHLNDQGQCKAVNAAAAIVTTPWIMVSNDDMIYPPSWFNRLVIWFQPDMHCISPQLVEPKAGAPTFRVKSFGGAGGDFDKQGFFNFSEDNDGDGFRTGFNLPFLIEKDLWDVVGGYDVNYDPWGSNSDSDLLYKIKLAGVQPYQNTNCLVYHFSQTSGTFQAENQMYWHKNFKYFEDKWGFPRTDNRIWEADFLIPKKERIFRPQWEGSYE